MLLPLLLSGLIETTGGGFAAPAAEGVSSRNFAISMPYVHARGDDLSVSGSVCRRANFYGLSPPRLQIEAIGPEGKVVGKSYAFLAALSGRADQRCGHYGALLKTHSRPVARVRVCAVRHGDCPRR
jgi:hypothetical protein